MKYSQSTELAIESLLFIAAHPEQQDFSVEDVAQAQRVSVSYLAKVFQQLVKSGLLRSHRGAKGGYALARNAGTISLFDIAQVFEGASPLYECNANAKHCTLGHKCLIVATFTRAERAMHDVLRSVTLEELLKGVWDHSQDAEWVGVGPVAAVREQV